MARDPDEPPESEIAYLAELLGYIPEDLTSVPRQSTFKATLRLGPNADSEIGRQAIRERMGWLPWLRRQFMRDDDVGQLACALLRHETVGLDGPEPPATWVQLASRIIRGVVVAGAGKVRLHAAIHASRAEFATTADLEPDIADERAPEFQKAAE